LLAALAQSQAFTGKHLAKYLKHLKQANKQSRVLTFQKRWPAELAEAAKAASYPAMFTMPTRCPVDGSVDDQLKAQKTGIAEFNKAVALLIGWAIELQPLPSHQAASKQPLNPEQQKQLLEAVVSHAGPTAAMVAAMMAGGVMVSEIARLDVEAVRDTLARNQPYIVIGAGGSTVKTEARRRIVPIVWPTAVMDVIREYLPAAIERSAKGTDPSATVNKWMRARGIPTTGHGLRHTLSAAAQTAVANPIALARIGGWSMTKGEISKQSLEYGRSVSDSELIDGLTEAAHEIWRHVLAMY